MAGSGFGITRFWEMTLIGFFVTFQVLISQRMSVAVMKHWVVVGIATLFYATLRLTFRYLVWSEVGVITAGHTIHLYLINLLLHYRLSYEWAGELFG